MCDWIENDFVLGFDIRCDCYIEIVVVFNFNFVVFNFFVVIDLVVCIFVCFYYGVDWDEDDIFVFGENYFDFGVYVWFEFWCFGKFDNGVVFDYVVSLLFGWLSNCGDWEDCFFEDLIW